MMWEYYSTLLFYPTVLLFNAKYSWVWFSLLLVIEVCVSLSSPTHVMSLVSQIDRHTYGDSGNLYWIKILEYSNTKELQ